MLVSRGGEEEYHHSLNHTISTRVRGGGVLVSTSRGGGVSRGLESQIFHSTKTQLENFIFNSRTLF